MEMILKGVPIFLTGTVKSNNLSDKICDKIRFDTLKPIFLLIINCRTAVMIMAFMDECKRSYVTNIFFYFPVFDKRMKSLK